MVRMRERDDDAPGSDSGSLADGLGETAPRHDGGLDPDPVDAHIELPGDASGEVGDVGGDTYGDGAAVDDPPPGDASDDGTFGGADDPSDDPGAPEGGPAGSGPLLDLGDEAQSHTIVDGIEFLVGELQDALLGADDVATPDHGALEPDVGDDVAAGPDTGLDGGAFGL
jgi:hypothetical protein